MVFDNPKFQEFLLNTLQSRSVTVKSAGTKVDFSEKCTLSFLHDVLSIQQTKHCGEGVQIGSPGRGCNGLLYFIESFCNYMKCSLKEGKENEPMMVNKAKCFPSNYTNRVVHLFTALLQSIVNICYYYMALSHKDWELPNSRV